MKSRLLQLTRVAISLSLLGVLFWAMRGRINEIFDIIKNMNPGLFAVGFLAAIIAVAILGLRLRYLLATQGIPMGLRDSVSLSFIGFFFNNFLPTSVGGDIVKAYYASKKTRDKIGCFTTVFLDRLFGVSSLILLAAGSAALTHFYLANTSIVWPIFVILGLLSLFFIVLWNRNIARFALAPILILVRWPAINKRLALEEKLKKIYNIINGFKDKKQIVLHVIIISLFAQVISFLTAYFWLRGMGSPVSLGIVLMTLPIVIISSMLPSINGLGIREGAIVFLLAPHAGKEAAFALSILWFFLLMALSLIGGLNYVLDRQYSFKDLKGGLLNDRQTAS